MLSSLSKAPASFYTSTPPGQIVNRFSNELSTIDSSLPEQLGWVLTCFSSMAFSAVAIVCALSFPTLLPLALTGLAYYKMTTFFRPPARVLKVAESKSRSPVAQLVSEARLGATAVSRSGTGPAWLAHFQSLVEVNAATFWTLKNADRYLSLRLETLANLLVYSCALFSSVTVKGGGRAGWGVTQALAVTGLLNWAVRCLTETEQVRGLAPPHSQDLDSLRSLLTPFARHR